MGNPQGLVQSARATKNEKLLCLLDREVGKAEERPGGALPSEERDSASLLNLTSFPSLPPGLPLFRLNRKSEEGALLMKWVELSLQGSKQSGEG